MSKKLILFFIANFMLAIFIILHFFNKNVKVENVDVKQQIVTSVVDKKVPLSTLQKEQPKVVTKPIESKPATIEPISAIPIVSSCTIYGPVNSDNKIPIEAILNKVNVLSGAQIITKPVYEIYWDLGNNQNNATNLFDKQKNGGALQSNKFQLKQDKSGIWYVPIAEITADENSARITTKELSEKADRLNTGGKWLYRTRENNYFYQFNKSNIIPSDIKAVLEKTFAIPKATC